MSNYNFTVDSLLRKAGRSRSRVEEFGRYHTDHIVELQLIVAALNTLRNNTYSRKGWARDLVDFFNDSSCSSNLQRLRPFENIEKGAAVRKWISGVELSTTEWLWIRQIRCYWDKIKDELTGFKRFKRALDDLLSEDELETKSEQAEKEAQKESKTESGAMDYEVGGRGRVCGGGIIIPSLPRVPFYNIHTIPVYNSYMYYNPYY